MSNVERIIRLPPVDYLHACFDYYPKAGDLVWKVRPREHFGRTGEWTRWNVMFAGRQAGTINSRGYLVVLIKSRSYLVHRIVWKISTGKDVLSEIDHEDRNRTNNRWSNLRLATSEEQRMNEGLRSNNKSGRRGVFGRVGRWRSQIRRRHLGYFATVEEASAAYEAAARKLHGKFYQGR
jgi:hypothetical protein